MADKAKKLSIHKKSGEFDDNLTIYDIEKAFHPRAKEVISEELEKLVDKIFKDHVEKGSIKDADKAADEFIELLAKYHFGGVYDAVKSDKKHVIETLKQKYGISRNKLKSAFKKKGTYRSREAFYKAHKDPLVDRAHEAKLEDAQQSLDFYLKDVDGKDEVADHIETRTGKKLADTYKKIMDLQDTVMLIGNYMQLPGAEEKIQKNKKATLNLPDASAGHPSTYSLFAKGSKYADTYHEEAKKVATTHKLKGKGK